MSIYGAKNARHMRWHKEGTRANPDAMVHPFDDEAWKHFNLIRPDLFESLLQQMTSTLLYLGHHILVGQCLSYL
jgi:hypothetical protein